MREILNIAKALSDQNRIRALAILEGRSLCVCQIIEVLGLAASTVSKHMSILRQAGLVDGDKEGRWMYYRLPGRDGPEYVRIMLKQVLDTVRDDRKVIEDRKKLAKILKLDKEQLCRNQRS